MTENNFLDKKIVVAKVISAFGIKGQVKILSFCKDPLDIEKYDCFDEKNNKIKIKISNKNKASIGFSKNGDAILIANISEIDDRNKAEEIRGIEIFTTRDQFDEINDDDEFYQSDLIGLDVIDESSQKIGKVLNIFDFGGGAMLEIEFLDDKKPQDFSKIDSLPFKNEYFGEIDVEKNTIEILTPQVIVARD